MQPGQPGRDFGFYAALGLEQFDIKVNDSDPAAEDLWGPLRWAEIATKLQEILKKSKELDAESWEVVKNQADHPKTKGWQVIERRKHVKCPSRYEELQQLANSLKDEIDGLWKYSVTVFDKRHERSDMASGPKLPGPLLESALQLRAGSMKLFHLCRLEISTYSLDMNLFQDGVTWEHLKDGNTRSSSFRYNLAVEKKGQEIRCLTVSDLLGRDNPALAGVSNIVHFELSNVQILQNRSGMMTVQVGRYDSGDEHYLHITPVSSPAGIPQDSTPESLASIFSRQGRSEPGDLDVTARLKLAYKIVEAAFFLIGTPWFAYLDGRSLRRYRLGPQGSSSFKLLLQPSGLGELVYCNPKALAESAQIARLGVLLVEIAIAATDDETLEKQLEEEVPISINKLPLVERSMGVQYRNAAAYCLNYRGRSFASPEKFATQGADWKTYLMGFLHEYYARVFLV
ncbi:MAG: hypothetical protein LQ350_007997 [Teloschistes chrysophthalmus]|nr:MAG: hypothetical protein LQ350_007997 [Niorma chrysophthalma]